MCAGLCIDSCSTLSLPRPTFPGEERLAIVLGQDVDWSEGGIPPVMKITFPERSGMSVDGLKETPLPRRDNPNGILRSFLV